MLDKDLWTRCLRWLEAELSERELSTWLRPLQPVFQPDRLILFAPNRIVQERVRQDHLEQIRGALAHLAPGVPLTIDLMVGVAEVSPAVTPAVSMPADSATDTPLNGERDASLSAYTGKLDPRYTFNSFIEGKSNQQARAASEHVVEAPGMAYNPLLIYGESGLGKTHLMHAVGNRIQQHNPNANIAYLGAEQWLNHMVSAIRHGRQEGFKHYYRSVDALLIDDIHFFAHKERTQEEFFHTFNALIDGRKQIVLTCDRYPKDIDGIDERLKSRFTWGLSVAVEPPELETRVAILMAKADQAHVRLSEDVAFFVAQRIRSNVRELEGALHRLSASARLRGEPITVEFAQATLRDMLAAYDRLVTIDNIKRTVAGYYNIRISDLTSAKRTRSLARPRQVAMALCKELTQHSLPEIGEAFDKDHTTVLHACRKVVQLRDEDPKIREDYDLLQRRLGFG
ncbi:MAG: chromosomal replication initiator protein DnaA [Polycyclovorans sp.]|jgi:chromosomal replication initiator protein|nr:chromosomal replication initiator protein DnaA [Gammaproteobacteria bacterium]MDP1541909.1 chromosomal replication initiator protein DnaA [Polycyclovorans sp.]MEC8849401.1 chromosomal replication initiator protein DnaA [Pseudomonadota bacterium]|tara:strand:+ start:8792 stop:10156 length:1365 start_codon:yes stop_codon:yes gene_type:complete